MPAGQLHEGRSDRTGGLVAETNPALRCFPIMWWHHRQKKADRTAQLAAPSTGRLAAAACSSTLVLGLAPDSSSSSTLPSSFSWQAISSSRSTGAVPPEGE